MEKTLASELKPSDQIPGPKGWEAFSLLWRMKNDSLKAYDDLHQKHGDVVVLQSLQEIIMLFHPDDAHRVMRENHANYKKSSNYKEVEPVLGQGLVTSEGELWRRQRQTVGKMFTTSSIKAFFPQMQQSVHEFIHNWEGKGDRFELDFSSEMNQLTLRIASEIFFGYNVSNTSQDLANALYTASEIEIKRIYSVLRIPRWIPTPSNTKERKAVAVLDSVVYGLIDQYQHSDDAAPNVLSRLMKTGMPRKQLRDEVMTLLLAGHETTSNALTWTVLLLSQNPDKLKILQEELNSVLGQRLPDYTDLEKLPYLNNVILESMRLLPPVPIISKETLGTDVLGGYEVHKGRIIMLAPWVTHRDPRFWDSADRFMPERFEKEKSPKAYFPFALGPRKCIGADFSMVEARLILSSLLQRFAIQVVPGFDPGRKVGLTLSPLNGLKVHVAATGKN